MPVIIECVRAQIVDFRLADHYQLLKVLSQQSMQMVLQLGYTLRDLLQNNSNLVTLVIQQVRKQKVLRQTVDWLRQPVLVLPLSYLREVIDLHLRQNRIYELEMRMQQVGQSIEQN